MSKEIKSMKAKSKVASPIPKLNPHQQFIKTFGNNLALTSTPPFNDTDFLSIDLRGGGFEYHGGLKGTVANAKMFWKLVYDISLIDANTKEGWVPPANYTMEQYEQDLLKADHFELTYHIPQLTSLGDLDRDLITEIVRKFERHHANGGPTKGLLKAEVRIFPMTYRQMLEEIKIGRIHPDAYQATSQNADTYEFRDCGTKYVQEV